MSKDAHDSEDGKAAKKSYGWTLEDQFVLEGEGDAMLGVIGAHPLPNTEDGWLLSWTYLKKEGLESLDDPKEFKDKDFESLVCDL